MRIGVWILPNGNKHFKYWLKVIALIKQEKEREKLEQELFNP